MQGQWIERIQTGSSIYFYITGGYGVSIESEINLASDTKELNLPPDSTETEHHLRPLIGLRISSCSAEESSGKLSISFTDDKNLTVSADNDYESWNMIGPNEFRLVCMPGGELAIWRSIQDR